ncbi:hypothetical protein BDR05DRAFT_426230 [Suillus weaverae]|nr:hypothetical protein BDR05DRAFT_426230 [Suillus weaverae]
MTQVSDDPSLWLDINLYRVASYFAVAGSVGVFYDWALTFGQEVELIWRQRWSLMTVLYLSVRYLGIAFAVLQIPGNIPTISVTDTVSWILYVVMTWMSVIVFPMLRAIMITRLHAMYQRSRKILIFLIVTFLADTIFNVVASVMSTRHTTGGTVNYRRKKCARSSLMNTRGTHSVRHLCVLNQLWGYHTSGFRYLDTRYCVGGLRAVSRSLDCCQTLP